MNRIVIKGDKCDYYYNPKEKTVSDGIYTISAYIKDIESQDKGNVAINLDFLFDEHKKSLRSFEQSCEEDLKIGIKWRKLPDE